MTNKETDFALDMFPVGLSPKVLETEEKAILLRRLQAQTLPDATPLLGKIPRSPK